MAIFPLAEFLPMMFRRLRLPTRFRPRFAGTIGELAQSLTIGAAAAGLLLVPVVSIAQTGAAGAPGVGAAGGEIIDAPEGDGQFRKNTSPSGLQIGVTDAADVAGLPEELRELGEAGALASADRKWQEAKDAYTKMVELAPDNPLALANLGMVEYRLENYEVARDHLRHSLSKAPTIAHHWLALALCYVQLEETDLAFSCLFRARHEDETDPRVHLYLAVLARDHGWPIAAETELQRAIALDPQYTDAHFNLALLYLERNPPAIELARRHYFFALDLGATPDFVVEEQLKAAPASD